MLEMLEVLEMLEMLEMLGMPEVLELLDVDIPHIACLLAMSRIFLPTDYHKHANTHKHTQTHIHTLTNSLVRETCICSILDHFKPGQTVCACLSLSYDSNLRIWSLLCG